MAKINDAGKYYESIVIDSLAIDMESFDLLQDAVRAACQEEEVGFSEQLFSSQFLEMVNTKKIIPCIYDQQSQTWREVTFHREQLSDYWFKSQTKCSE